MEAKHLVGHIREALATDPRTNVLDLTVKVAGRKAFIIGEVASQARKQAAREVGARDEGKLLAEELADVGVPIVAVLGNHDYHLVARPLIRTAYRLYTMAADVPTRAVSAAPQTR